MSVNVVGVLKTPLDLGMSATVRITAKASEGDTLMCAEGIVITGDDGIYDFTLVEGIFDIEVNGDDEYCLTGTTEVTGATPATVTLVELLTTYEYVPPV